MPTEEQRPDRVRAAKKRSPRYDSKAHTANPNGPYFGLTICFTGTLPMLREEAAKGAALLGYQPVRGVTAKTDVLVVGKQAKVRGSSSKERNAAKHGVRTITGAEFVAMLKGHAADSPLPPLAAKRKQATSLDLQQGDT